MSWKSAVKKIVLKSGPLRSLVCFVTPDFPRVFMYHRFSAAGEEIPGRVSADNFAWQLEQMQKFGRVMSLASCIDHYQQTGKWPARTVVVTVDDGYRDFYLYAYPELKKRGLPATFFTTVNFINRKIWLWPDRLDAALKGKSSCNFTINAHGNEEFFSYTNEDERKLVWKRLSDLCITLPNHLRFLVISQAEEELGADLPEIPTKEYEASTWDELREMSAAGIEVGSHTMNHPILSKISESELDDEIARSKQILEEKLETAVRTFCYPNSCPDDINAFAVNKVEECKYSGAVFYFDLRSWDRFRIPRMNVSEWREDFYWKLCGGEFYGCPSLK